MYSLYLGYPVSSLQVRPPQKQY